MRWIKKQAKKETVGIKEYQSGSYISIIVYTEFLKSKAMWNQKISEDLGMGGGVGLEVRMRKKMNLWMIRT